MPKLFGDRGLEITKYLVVLYSFFKPYPTSPDPNIYMNLALEWTAEEAIQRLLSYLMYIPCGSKLSSQQFADRATDKEAVTKNLCKDILDVTKPPWNFPPSLDGNNFLNDTISNINANATLAINLPQSFYSLASLVQGTPADSIGTS